MYVNDNHSKIPISFHLKTIKNEITVSFAETQYHAICTLKFPFEIFATYAGNYNVDSLTSNHPIHSTTCKNFMKRSDSEVFGMFSNDIAGRQGKPGEIPSQREREDVPEDFNK